MYTHHWVCACGTEHHAVAAIRQRSEEGQAFAADGDAAAAMQFLLQHALCSGRIGCIGMSATPCSPPSAPPPPPPSPSPSPPSPSSPVASRCLGGHLAARCAMLPQGFPPLRPLQPLLSPAAVRLCHSPQSQRASASSQRTYTAARLAAAPLPRPKPSRA